MRLTAQDIVKNFGEKQVLRHISFAAESGQALGLLGRNGAGKTTTLRILMNVFPADSGAVLLDGQPLHSRALRIGYLPEERGLYPKKPIREQLIYLGMLRGMSRTQAQDDIRRLLRRMEMAEYEDKKLDTLSKGNQQKIQLVAALLGSPDIVILDEPFSGLDPVNAMLLKDVVREQIAEGHIVLFSSHQMHYVEEFCSQIAILSGGRIALSGDIRAIKRGYDRRRIVISALQPERVRAFAAERLGDIAERAEVLGDDILLTLRDAAQRPALMAALASQPLEIDSMRVWEPSLNDIFVQYTEESI